MSKRTIVQIYTGASRDVRDHFLKQLPTSPDHPLNHKYEFRINGYGATADYLVMVFQVPPYQVKVRVPKGNTVYLNGEPRICDVSPNYIRKFDTVISPHPLKGSRHAITSCGAAMLWAVEKSYDELVAEPIPDKTKMLSVICSSQSDLIGQRKRLVFVEMLQKHFGDAIDIYGRGIRPFQNKWDVITPYKYHIVLENSSEPHYWTEKVNDALLASSYPFYWGAPNIHDYLPQGSLTPIDIYHPQQAIATIEQGMANQLYEQSVASREKAKDKIMNEYNLFVMLDKIITEKEAAGSTLARRKRTFVVYTLGDQVVRALRRSLVKITLFSHLPAKQMIRVCFKKLCKIAGAFRM